MSDKKLLIKKLSVILGILVLISLACELPKIGGVDITGENNPVQQTANSLATSVIGTQTAVVADIAPTVADAIDSIAQTAIPEIENIEDIPQIVPEEVITQVPDITTLIPALTEEIPEVEVPPETESDTLDHQNSPQDPGVAKAILEDAVSISEAGQNTAPSLSENYDVNLFERPFSQYNTDYLPDVDIVKAELAADGFFYYVTIYLNNVSSSSQALDANYGVELDTDKDGRGDFLIWSAAPKSTKWSVNPVSVYTDVNNDVGSNTVLKSDAPTGGNGYETLLFDIDHYTDPDVAWSRNAPSTPKAIQIAFKQDILDNKKSFLWSVWADKSLQDPSKFDYNDLFTIEEAGSALENNDNYPIVSLHSMDNSCRMGYGSAMTGNEPGICGEIETIDVTVPTIEITSIPLPDLPDLP